MAGRNLQRRTPEAGPGPVRRRPRRRTALAVGGLLAVSAACGGTRPDSGSGPSGPASTGVMAGPDIRLAATLQPFDACPDVLRWFQDEALRRVGPYGLPGGDTMIPFAGESLAVPDAGRSAAAPGSSPSDSAAAPATPAFSGTNVQEAGVDEPDSVETDGRRLLSVAGDQLRVLDLTGGSPSLAGRVTLPGPGATRILLRGDRVLAIAGEDGSGTGPVGSGPAVGTGIAEDRAVPYPTRPGTRLSLIDVADPSAPKVTRSVVADGRFVDARLVDGWARVVTTAAPRALPFVYPSGGSAGARDVARRANEDAVRRATIEDWLPRVRAGDARPDDPGTPLVPCDRLRHPQEFSGLDTLAVLSLDLGRDSLDTADAIGLVAGGDVAYASDRSLYVATTVQPDPVDAVDQPVPDKGTASAATEPGSGGGSAGSSGPTVEPSRPSTVEPANAPGSTPPAGPSPSMVVPPAGPSPSIVAPPAPPSPLPSPDPGFAPTPAPAPIRSAIHAFGIADAGPAVYRASGLVDGTVGDRWSLSEHAGHLRVLTTTGSTSCPACWPGGGRGAQSQVSVLAEEGGELKVVGTAGDMGRGETVKAVRFLGDRGYVVTFRQVDPFYVLDLADPTRPRVVGELEMPGYSAYLHPVGEGLVLGVGQDGTARGLGGATKVALYDVSDPAHPREVGHQVLAGTRSQVEQDARAFLWWGPTRLAVVPTTGAYDKGSGGPGGEVGAVGYRVDGTALTEVGRVGLERSTGADQGLRSVVVGDSVLTVAAYGVRTSSLESLQSRSWLPL
jgi:hypothetical protein